MTEPAACRLCGSVNTQPRFPRLSLPLLLCRDCGVIFRPSALADRDPAATYDRDYYFETWPGSLGRFFKDFDPEAHNKTRFFIRELREFERILGRPGRVLDVGTANGVFVWLADRQGWKAEGVELSPFAVNWGRNQFHADLIEGSIADLSPEPRYDLITLWDTLEHVLDPRRTLRDCYQRLAPGGILAILTPDTLSLVNRLLHLAVRVSPSRAEPWLRRLYHEDHLTAFNRHNLSRSLVQEGFIIHWIEGYDEDPRDTETAGPVRAGVFLVRLAAALIHRQHELLAWARKP